MSAYEDYDGPTCWADCSAEELAEAVVRGILCSECGCEFTDAHEHKVACSYCWVRLPLAEQREVAKATHEELNRVAHANAARKRRKNV